MKLKLSELLDIFKLSIIETFLQYPIIWSFCFTCCTLPLQYLIFGGRWELIALFFVIVFLLAIFATINMIPALSIADDRVILRPTPLCSSTDSKIRFLNRTLNDQHQSLFYDATTEQECSSSDENISNATKCYIISLWKPSSDDLVTIESDVQFQPENSHGENKPAYHLPKDYFVRSVGSRDGERQRVQFYSLSKTGGTKLESGHINSNSLKSVPSGWYRVSNCKCELSRWWYRTRDEYVEGYVNSYFVRISQYYRTFLLEDSKNM